MTVLRSVENIRLAKDLSTIGKDCLGIKSLSYDRSKCVVNFEFSGTDRQILEAMQTVGESCIIISTGSDTVWIQYQTPNYLKMVEGLLPIEALTLPLVSVCIGEIADVL